MRGLLLPLTQTQKIRLQRALEKLELLSLKANSNASVTIADTIPIDHNDGFLKGHGTLDVDGEVIATVCGVVERINKLVYVRTLRARYKLEVGDVIVGRVIEVIPKRWKLNINYSQDVVLMLSSINLLDGIQRRRTAEDELNMRVVFEENDVGCAEVRGLQHEGVHLQARSQKYGKLRSGQLLSVPPYLVKRRKQHLHHLYQLGVDLILGCNGFIWVGEHAEPQGDMAVNQENDLEPDLSAKKHPAIEVQACAYTPIETRQNICRIAKTIRVVSTLGFTNRNEGRAWKMVAYALCSCLIFGFLTLVNLVKLPNFALHKVNIFPKVHKHKTRLLLEAKENVFASENKHQDFFFLVATF